MKLNLGGNEEYDGGPDSPKLEGFTHVDIRQIDGVEIVCDVSKKIPLEDNSVEEIRASHIIEHIHPDEIDSAITEWVRILKPGGLLRVYCPSAELIAKAFVMGDINITRFSELIFGAQKYEGQDGIVGSDDELAASVNIHRAAWSKERINALLECEGLTIIGNEPRPNAYPFDLGVQARKPQ